MSHSKLPPSFRWIIWMGLFSSTFVYFIILQFGLIPVNEVSGDSSLRLILYGIGFGAAVVSMGIKYVVGNLRDSTGGRVTPRWIDAAFIVCLALAESPALFGLMLGLQGGSPKDSLPLFIISAAAFLLAAPPFFYPRPDQD